LEFCEEIYKKLCHKYSNFYYGESEYMFFIFEDDVRIIVPDMYIKDINLVIEFYGDFWHKNPLIYDISQEFVKETWERDEKRISILEKKINSNVIIVWEYDYRKDPDGVINKIVDEIIMNYGKD